MHLRGATQGVGVLHAVAVRSPVGGHHAGVLQDRRQVGRRGGLAGVRPDRLELGGEDPVGGELGLHRHGRRDVRRTHQEGEVGQRQDEHPEHPVGAVDQREALLGRELDRRQPRGLERLRRRHQLTVRVAHVALADQRQRAVRERREVAGAAERAVLVHHGRDARVEQAGHQLRHLRAYAGPAGRERGQAQQHQPTHDLALHLRTRAGSVRAHQRALELRAHLGAGCASSPAPRTPWRCHRREWELPRARPPRRAPSQWRHGPRR